MSPVMQYLLGGLFVFSVFCYLVVNFFGLEPMVSLFFCNLSLEILGRYPIPEEPLQPEARPSPAKIVLVSAVTSEVVDSDKLELCQLP
jgi:hypothetical protein